MWLYDIILKESGECVGNQGDGIFDTKEFAFEDALDFIVCELSNKYKKTIEDFKIECYKAFIV